MFPSSASSRRFLKIHLALTDYPILSDRIRACMRQEMFSRNIINPQDFEKRVRSMAVKSQDREGLRNPLAEDSSEIWERRIREIREHLTVLLFSQNLTFEIFEKIANEVLTEQGVGDADLELSINLELAPMELVFEYAGTINNLPPEERTRYESRLQEATVVLIRTLISDQLQYMKIAREWFTIEDLSEIRRHKIGAGRIGGKAAGMLLATRILEKVGGEKLKGCLRTPESYYVGAGELYSFMSYNNLGRWNTQKYKSEKQMRDEYPQIVRDFEAGVFPDDIVQKLKLVVEQVGQTPMIVRSSSLLEDNFGTSFAGKYDSIFLPNQGSLKENLQELIRAMSRIYASTLNPSALLYRRSMGLQEYDERMALLIQVVEGERYGRYYLPHAAGVAFSRNLYRWHPQIRREDGFVRMVWGLGTRAVDRVGNDYPRMIALSHPLLRPSTEVKSIRRYSQQYVDLIDLEENRIKTLPVADVLHGRYPPLRYLAQVDEGGYFSSIRSSMVRTDPECLVLTFDELLRRTSFAEQMRDILHILEEYYHLPVDMEFTLYFDQTNAAKPKVNITLLQCRPQSHLVSSNIPLIPKDLPEKNKIFTTSFVVPDGYIGRVDYVVFVVPEAYYSLPTEHDRQMLARAVGNLNAVLKDESFILIGPGRWGSSNSDLGVPIDYGDIYHSRAIVELTGEGVGAAPEPSLGTHFFQDLMEAHIYPLAVYLDDKKTSFNRKFFYQTPNILTAVAPDLARFKKVLRLMRVSDFKPDYFLRIIMNEEQSLAVAYLESAQGETGKWRAGETEYDNKT